ncbi:MAG: YraN family protein [Clostridiales bacterium]|nr:YraN family protein [Clostridiales bacterium]
MSEYLKGLRGEALAAKYLKKQGLKILEKRFRYGAGEIDIIALDGDTVCFEEVKYRPDGTLGSGKLAVDQNKRRRMRSAAEGYLKTHPAEKVRYDIVEIMAAGISWYKKAF